MQIWEDSSTVNQKKNAIIESIFSITSDDQRHMTEKIQKLTFLSI